MEQLIYQKLAAIMKDCGAITKSRRNQQQNFDFRGIDDVMNELHDIFSKNEVFILQEVTDYKIENRQSAKGTVMAYTRATVKFTYMTTDGSSVSTINVGEAMDSGDKGMNKAMSIALKYSLLQMLLIPTAEKKDPDADTPEETDYMALAMQEINGATTIQVLTEIWKNYKDLQTNNNFVSALTNKKLELRNQ